MKRTVLFDLGNTLVAYWPRPAFPAILQQAIRTVQTVLHSEGLLTVDDDALWRRVADEDHESPDHAVRPLEGRLTHIFQLDDLSDNVAQVMCRRFMASIFARGRVYDDVVPVLTALRSRGVATGIVSNTPWGSPAALWREELRRLGLASRVDGTSFCQDVGWRKPARPIFAHALAQLQATPSATLFVGDDPRWDRVGPHALGMTALIIDREGDQPSDECITTLHEVLDHLTEVTH